MNTKSCQRCGNTLSDVESDTSTEYLYFEVVLESGGKKYEAGPFCVDCYENILCGFRLKCSGEWKSGVEEYLMPSFEEDKK